MRVILDTNIWRYLVDNNCQNKLYEVTHKQDIQVVVAPSIVIETLRMNDVMLRKKIVEFQTRSCWERLMPDAYLQCEDVKREMIRLHPDWTLKNRDAAKFKNLRYDWIRTKGGFWEKARIDTNKIATYYQSKDAASLEQARRHSQDTRKMVLEKGVKMTNSTTLQGMTGSYKTSEGNEISLDAWRLYAMVIWENMLTRDSAFQQWIGCDMDINLVFGYYAKDFVNFWESEVSATALPREWLRFALYVLQSERKVTDGNPVDSALAVHLLDADVFISADKNFVSMANQIQKEAPFKTAHGFLVGGHSDGLKQLFNAFERRFSKDSHEIQI